MAYPRDTLAEAVSKSLSISGVVRNLGLQYRSGSAWNSVRKAILKYGLNTDHFLGKSHNKGVSSSTKLSPSQILVITDGRNRTKPSLLRRAILESGVPYRCSSCGVGAEWNGRKLVLEVDHQNGSWSDCRLSNLRFLCPNCHSQEPTSTHKKNLILTNCRGCGGSITSRVDSKGVQDTLFCSPACGSKFSPRLNQERGSWPTASRLKGMVWEAPVDRIAKEIGVSGSAVKKRCKRLGIDTPPRGYWSKRG
jgi:5-methylcytosine-specific restriction endonuclease McrA